MKGPQPTQLTILHTWLRARALRGLPLPSLDGIAREIEVCERNRVTELLRQGEERGLFVVTYASRSSIHAIAAPDGSWRAERGEVLLPERRCLRCRRLFRPEHRTNFLCGCPEPGARARADHDQPVA